MFNDSMPTDGSSANERSPIPRLMKPGEVAAALSCSVRTIYAVIATGDLRTVRVGQGGGAIRVHPADLAAYVNRLRGADDQSPDGRRPAGSPPGRPRARRPESS